MTDKRIFLTDMVVIDQPVSTQIRDDVVSILKDNSQSVLKATIDATHSGVLTNRRVYPGAKVKKGFKSFFSKEQGGTSDFNKPVLTHHNDFADPIGRVVNAVFTSLKSGEDFKFDYMSPDSAGGRGSGVVTVTAEIVDPDSIQKIIDGRYLSVSAGHSTDAMFCSICGESIYGEDCMHIPGRSYSASGEVVDSGKGSLCYGITNNMEYHEVSFVNLPAQPPAKLIEFNWETGKDSYLNGDSIISLTRGKKDIIKGLTLCNDSLEYSLLTGKDSNKKQKTIFIPSSAADKLREKLLLEEIEAKKDEPNDCRSSSSNNSESTEATEVKELDAISKANNSINCNTEKENSKKDKQKMDEELKKLADEISSLKALLATAEAKVTELTQSVDSKNSALAALEASMSELKKDMATHLATALASYRMRLNKPDTKGLDTDEKKAAYIALLSKRSVESLKDSINDLLIESEQTLDEVKPTSNSKATDFVQDQRLESNSLAEGKKASTKKTEKDEFLN